MLLFKNKTKIKAYKENKIGKEKSKLHKVLACIMLFSFMTISTASLFYYTQVKPEINEITKIVNKNKLYLSSVPDSIFNDNYSDKDFKDDIKLFDRIYEDLTKDKNSKEMTDKKRDFLFETFNQIAYLNVVNPTVGYDRIYEGLLIIPSTILDDTNKEKNQNIRYENSKFMNKKFKNKKYTPILIKNGIFYPTNIAYDNIVKAFNSRYKNESYIKAFIVNGSNVFNAESIESPEKDLSTANEVYKEQIKDIKTLQKNIESAYLNKDYEKLKIYFKQQRQFFKYIAGLDIGNNEFSSYSYFNREDNTLMNMVKMGIIYKSLQIQGSTEEDAFINTTLY